MKLIAACTLLLSAFLAREAPGQATAAQTHIKKVFLIVMENRDWSSIQGNSRAPYINNVLLAKGAHATRYYAPSSTDGSLQNYLWLESGQSFNVPGDALPTQAHESTGAHLVTLLRHANISWKTYQEGISGTVCPLNDTGLYVARHNPFVYFDDVTNGNDPHSAYCIAHNRPFSELSRDLSQHHAARYNFITPNMCNDMHDSCAPTNNPVAQGDAWLSRVIPTIMGSAAYKTGGAIMITWDEGEGSGAPIGLIVLSPWTKPGYAGTSHFDHGSTLRTVQEIFGVRPILGGAAQSTDLRSLFRVFP